MKKYKLYTGQTAVWAMSNDWFKECKQIDTDTTGTWWFETKVLLGCAKHFSISQLTACSSAVWVHTHHSHQATARSSKKPTAKTWWCVGVVLQLFLCCIQVDKICVYAGLSSKIIAYSHFLWAQRDVFDTIKSCGVWEKEDGHQKVGRVEELGWQIGENTFLLLSVI